MKIRLLSKKNIENLFSSIKKILEDDGFIVEEKDRTYEFKKIKENIDKHLIEILFWAKKSSFNNLPPNISILIEGQIKSSEEIIIEIELKEYHGYREHTMTGSLKLEEYIDFFYKIL